MRSRLGVLRILGKLILVQMILALVTGCGRGPATEAAPQLTVYAAASLQRSFTTIGQRFETEHPGTKIRFVFAGSSDLVAQLSAGAPGDVLATADQSTMTKAESSKLVETPRPFATNNLVIVTTPGNPKRITGLHDLARPGITVALCADQVPCGRAAADTLRLAGVEVHPVTEESSVSGVLTKVMAAEVDAGLVYRTDAAGVRDTATVEFPESAEVTNVYPIAVTGAAHDRGRAQEFADWVVSPAGRIILQEAGFGAPPG